MTVNVIKANVVQQMDYYPFGLMWEAQDATQTNNLLWHHGKELQEGEFLQQGVSFDLEDFGARMYDPVVARWWSVDPLASNAPNWSPYRAFYCNPLKFVDPTGMFEDNYGLDKDGNITFLSKTEDKTDKLIVLDEKGAETDKSIEVTKGILNKVK